MNDKIIPFLPKEGLFKLYIDYTEVTEICPRFRFFAMAAAIGTLVKRRVWFQRSSHNLLPTLYPNIWIILVAPQGRGHKSTAIRTPRKFLESLPPNLQPKILAAKITPEAIIKALSCPTITAETVQNMDIATLNIIKKRAQGLIYSSELGVFLSKKDYNKDMIATLTDLYDCPDDWNAETIGRGTERLYDVCLSIMGCSTPDWMQTMIPQDAFRGGFMSRFLLITMPEGWYKRIADPPPPPENIEKEILEELVSLCKIEGEMRWTKEAKEFFEGWYHALKEPEPGPEAAYLERKQDHMLRIAILIQLTKNKSLTLERESIEQSLNILDTIQPETLKIIRYISIEPKMRIVQRIMEVMEAYKEVRESQLLDYVWSSLTRVQEFDEVLSMLLRSKKIKIEKLTSAGVVYKLIEEKEKKT